MKSLRGTQDAQTADADGQVTEGATNIRPRQMGGREQGKKHRPEPPRTIRREEQQSNEKQTRMEWNSPRLLLLLHPIYKEPSLPRTPPSMQASRQVDPIVRQPSPFPFSPSPCSDRRELKGAECRVRSAECRASNAWTAQRKGVGGKTTRVVKRGRDVGFESGLVV